MGKPAEDREHGPELPDWNEVKRKTRPAGPADRVILLAGVLLFVDGFLPWYRLTIGPFSQSVSGWEAGGLSILAVLSGTLAAGLAVARLLGMTFTVGGLKDGMVYLILGVGALLFALLELLTSPDAGIVQRGPGLWAGAILAAVLALAAWRKYSVERAAGTA